MPLRPLVPALLALIVPVVADGAALAAAHEPLVDLATATQGVEAGNFRVQLALVGLVPKADGGTQTDLVLDLNCVDGALVLLAAKGERHLPGRWSVDIAGLRAEGGRLRGPLQISLIQIDRKTRQEVVRAGALAIDAALAPEADGGSAQGALTGAFDGRDVQGQAKGPLRRPLRAGRFDAGSPAPGGIGFRFDMGSKRVNWTNFRAGTLVLPEARRDLSRCTGLKVTVAADAPRADAAVSVWLREDGGGWYYVKAAVPLIDPENSAVLRFADFVEAEWLAPEGDHQDSDWTLDLAKVTQLAIGVVNPFGIGDVSFRLTGLELVTDPPAPAPAAQLAVTGRLLEVNGHAVVPAPLFGGYAPNLQAEFRPGCQRLLNGPVSLSLPKLPSEQFIIDCWFDRGNPATILTNPNWKEDFAKWGLAYAQKAKEAKRLPLVLEFWNEPYLDWAKGKNYNPSFFKVDGATEGGPVQVLYKSKTGTQDGPVVPHFRWRKGGDGSWKVFDETQFTYWSGKGNGWCYDQMLSALAPALKQAAPEVTLIAGWGFRWNEDHWAAWDMLYKPTLDLNAQWIDGVHEHHYQGDVTSMPASYEFITAYGVTAHRKWWKGWNTETNDLIDAPARGGVDTPAKVAAASEHRKAVYNLRDCLYTVLETPDKVGSRTVIHPRDGGTWPKVAYGLMANLRGRLVETRSSADGQVWCVCAIDGTDPAAMPPAGADGAVSGPALVVMAFNDDRRARDVEIAIAAPAGTALTDGTLSRSTVDPQTLMPGLASERFAASGAAATLALRLEARQAINLTLPLTGTVPAQSQVLRTQHFAPELLNVVGRGKPATCTVAIDPQRLAAAKRAWLRLVVEDIAPGEATVAIAGGAPVPLPAALTADNVLRIVEVPVDPASLAASTPLTFSVNAGNFAGYRVDVASVMLEELR